MTEDLTGGGNAAPESTAVLTEGPVQAQVVAPDKKEPEKAPEQEKIETEDEIQDDDGPKEKKRRGGWQRKIDRLEAEIADLRKGSAPAKVEPAKAETAPDDKPKPDDFKTWDEYDDAKTDWKIKQADKAREDKIRADKDTEVLQAKIERYEDAKTKVVEIHPDFNDVVTEAFDDVPVNPAIRRALIDSDIGPEIVYYLAKNPDEFEKLNVPAMGLDQVSRAFGRIEARLEAAKASTSQAQPEVKTTKTPPPITPVTKKATTANTEFYDGMPFEEFKRWEKKQR